MIKNNPIFSYIDSDFENWNVVDKHPHVEKREINITTLEKDSTFAQMFSDPENQWVTQEELVDVCTNRKDEFSKDMYNFFLLKSENEFFVASVCFADGGRLEVRVRRLSHDNVWLAGSRPRLVVPATKVVILNSQPEALGTLDSSEEKLEKAIKLLVDSGYSVYKN